MGKRFFSLHAEQSGNIFASRTLKSKFLHIDELKAVNIKLHNDTVEALIA